MSGLGVSLAGLRIGVERAHHFPPESDPALAGTFERRSPSSAGLGAKLVDVSLPYYDEMRAATMVTSRAEAMAYHRGDLQSRWGDYFLATQVGVSRAVFASASDYVQAQRVRRAAMAKVNELFGDVDMVIGPASATPANSYEDLPARMMESAMRLSFTSYWNATGQPALVVPMGFNAEGLPLSLQITGRPFGEATILRVGDAYQEATDWHLRVPPIVTTAFASA